MEIEKCNVLLVEDSSVFAMGLAYAIDADADYKAVGLKLYNDHSEFDLLYEGKSRHVLALHPL